MISANQIKPDMPVMGSNGGQFALVDHMEGRDCIKLQRDESGQHHYIPLSWVASCENGEVKLNRPDDEAVEDWSEEPMGSNTRH